MKKRRGRLTARLAALGPVLQGAIDKHRKMATILEGMRMLSLEIPEARIQGIRKRKPQE